MDGITILSVGEYVESIGGAWSIASVSLLIFGSLLLLLGALAFSDSKTPSGLMAGILVWFMSGVIIVAAIQRYKSNGPTINIPRYKVTVSDSVPYNKFVEKYKVLEIEDKIYTVIDKVEYETARAEIKKS